MAEKAQGVGLLDYFSGLQDPRQAGKVLFPLDEIMLVVLCGVVSVVWMSFDMIVAANQSVPDGQTTHQQQPSRRSTCRSRA